MIIRYERTVEYELDVPPDAILKYAKEYMASEKHIHPQKTFGVSLEDIIEDITEEWNASQRHVYSCTMRQVHLSTSEIDYSQPRNASFPRLHEEEDPFHGVAVTIGELEENLKNLQLGKSLW
jgi:hypothetical protein